MASPIRAVDGGVGIAHRALTGRIRRLRFVTQPAECRRWATPLRTASTKYIADGSVDLVCFDPPLNSNRDYNVVLEDESGQSSDAQILAFEDTWHWESDADEG
jgi:hypothetical protein